jgi:hypothetical protein
VFIYVSTRITAAATTAAAVAVFNYACCELFVDVAKSVAQVNSFS